MDSGTLISLVVAIVIALGFIHLVWGARRVGRLDANPAVERVNSPSPFVARAYQFCLNCKSHTDQWWCTAHGWNCSVCGEYRVPEELEEGND